MRVFRNRVAQTGLAVGLCIASIGLPAMAQSRSNVRQGLPGRRISGGTRSECVSDRPVEALTTALKENEAGNEYTSVDFLLPKFKEVHPVEFKLRDSQGNTVYTESLQTGNVDSIVSIQILEKSLQENEIYHWYFSVVCNAQDRSQNITLAGQLQQPVISSHERQAEITADSVMTRHAAAR